jgi:hypothetical protein
VKLTTRLHLLPRSKNEWSYASTPQYAFMAWCSVKSIGTTLPFYYLWSIVLLEKLTVTQIVKKFPAFCVTRRFITVPLVPILSQMHPVHTAHSISLRPSLNVIKITCQFTLTLTASKQILMCVAICISDALSPLNFYITHILITVNCWL